MSADFLDTNVFIYLFDETDELKREAAQSLVETALTTGEAVISFQVVQETMNVLTRKLGVAPLEVRRFLDAVLNPLWAVGPSHGLYQAALEISDRYRYGFYDSLIVAAAQSVNAERLLSEDLQEGQQIGKLKIVNPFKALATQR